MGASTYWVQSLTRHQLKRRTMIEEDDDIQDYKRPWVGLTDAEIKKICDCTHGYDADERIARAVEQLLKEKNT
jgi:predicted 2-oxoglutarate/Fe(II)-dependent dioxygenase YbiX